MEVSQRIIYGIICLEGAFRSPRPAFCPLSLSFARDFRERSSKLISSISVQKPWEFLKYYHIQNKYREKLNNSSKPGTMVIVTSRTQTCPNQSLCIDSITLYWSLIIFRMQLRSSKILHELSPNTLSYLSSYKCPTFSASTTRRSFT